MLPLEIIANVALCTPNRKFWQRGQLHLDLYPTSHCCAIHSEITTRATQ